MLMVPLVRQASGLQQIRRDAVRLEGLRRTHDERREIHQLLRELSFFRLVEYRQVRRAGADRAPDLFLFKRSGRFTRPELAQ